MSQEYRVIKPAINFTRSDNKDLKRKGQMVRDESDLIARIQWLEQQISQVPHIQQKIRNQDQQIQVLLNDNELFRKIQQRLLDDTIKLKGSTVNLKGQESQDEDLQHIKSYLLKLQSAVTDVVVKQQDKIKLLEENIQSINSQLNSLVRMKTHENEEKLFKPPRDPYIEKLSDQLELLKLKHKTGMAISNRAEIQPFSTNPRSQSSNSSPSSKSHKKATDSLVDNNKMNLHMKNKQERNKKKVKDRASYDKLFQESKCLKTEESMTQIQRSEQKLRTQRPSSSYQGNLSPSRKHNKTQSFDEMFNQYGSKLQIPEALEKLKKRYLNNETTQEITQSISNTKKTVETAVNLWTLYGTKKSSLKGTFGSVSHR